MPNQTVIFNILSKHSRKGTVYAQNFVEIQGADIIMDIETLSIGLSQMKVAQEASISVMKMATDTVEVQAVDITQILVS